MIKALIFDVSGTILDDFDRVYATSVAAGKEFGVGLPEIEEMRKTHSTDWRGFWEKRVKPMEKAQGLLRRWVEIYESQPDNEKLIDGTGKFLDMMRKRYLLGIVTSNWKKHVTAALNRLGVDCSMFASIITPDSTHRLKPDPHMVQLCCEELRVAPSEAVFIGDMTQDIQAGRGAGTRTVAVAWGWHDNEELKRANPDFFADSWGDIEGWLEAQE
jgi:HAD superfamily hydrolase (TIGR01509 family)